MRFTHFLWLALLLGMVPHAQSQEGYPLNGTWRGEWGPAGEKGTLVVVFMEWDGTDVSGTLNPGRNARKFDGGRLDPEDWSVHIEVPVDDGQSISINGTLEDIGSYNRTIQGTWSQGEVEYPFMMRRE